MNYIRKISFYLFFISLFAFTEQFYAETYLLGGKKGWSDVNVRNGITTGTGRYGNESLVLDTTSRKKNPYTDLLLDFENGGFSDTTGNYTIVENTLFSSKKAVMGKGAALSRGKSGGLVLSGTPGSFFSTEGPAGSFMIDFWLCPSIVENGEIIFSWRSSRNIAGKIVYQLITASFYQDKIMCVFSNIFDGYTEDSGDVYLIGSRKLIPEKWSHHSICFTEDDGMLLYKVDGEVEDIQFMTETGHEGSSIFPAYIGTSAYVSICPKYTGLIDDFSVTRSYVNIDAEVDAEIAEALNPKRYGSSGGHFESVPILTKPGTIMNSLKAETDIPPQTEIHFYIRGGDNYFNWTQDYPEWIPVKNGEKITGLTGLYFQVAADLFPDGTGSVTPSVSEIQLDYTVLPEPQPPYKVSVQKGDGSVTLSWSYSTDDTAGGYYIYYGTRPGEYLGRYAAEGNSPIDVGNTTSYTITGLKNGTIYYFAIAAWSKVDSRIRGPLSKEVYARPGVK